MKTTQNLISLMGGALLGATAMYLLDPDMGRKRRRYIADHAGDYMGSAQDMLQSGWEKASDQARSIGGSIADKAQEYGQHLSDMAEEYSNRLSKQAGRTSSSWTDTAKDWMSSLSGVAGRWGKGGRKLFNRYSDQAQDYASDYASRASDTADDITDYSNELWQKVKGLGSRVSSTASSAGRRARSRAADLTEEHSTAVPVAITGIGCAALGLGLMYLIDPRLGRTRRAWLADKMRSSVRRTGRSFYGVGKDMANRAYGVAAETRSKFQSSGPISTQQLLQRVRSEMGRATSHPRLVQVMVDDSATVTLSGYVLANESGRLIGLIESIPGVSLVVNRLEVVNDEQELNRRASASQQTVPQM
ncbi:MAG TPA: BON domain-containing protein [Tepidisphaeraceae bacterium]|nr:BON domain-containing protein [Tepidisphaeraceae bacterium]